KRYIPLKIAAELAEHFAEDDLSEREIEVLREVAGGTSNKIIASHLSISEATVKAHVQNIMLKLGASDRTHAVSIAMTRGFLMEPVVFPRATRYPYYLFLTPTTFCDD